MTGTKSRRNLVALICVAALAIGGFLIFASQYNPNGLMPGDVYSRGLDVDRNEHTTGVTLLTVYGQEVINSPSLLRSAELGPREPRAYIAVVLPAQAIINGKGLRSEHGEDRSVLRETRSWSVRQEKNDLNGTVDDLNKTVEKSLTYEYDGRKQELRISSQSFPISDGNRFIVLLDSTWKVAVYRVEGDYETIPVSEEQRKTLRGFFEP